MGVVESLAVLQWYGRPWHAVMLLGSSDVSHGGSGTAESTWGWRREASMSLGVPPLLAQLAIRCAARRQFCTMAALADSLVCAMALIALVVVQGCRSSQRGVFSHPMHTSCGADSSVAPARARVAARKAAWPPP